jgi:hypothetical protein
MKYPDVALLIQGPIRHGKLDSLTYLDYYKSLFGEIVICTYTEHITPEITKVCSENNIKLVHQTINIPNKFRNTNVLFQTYCVLYGLKNITKKYCLKHRIDEKYNNIDKLVNKLLEDDEKKVSGTMYFSPKNRERFCSSDHVFIGKTDKLLKTFQLSWDNIQEGRVEGNSYEGSESAEITYTKNFLRISGEEPDLAKHDEQMTKYFDLVYEGEMQPFTIRQNYGEHVFYNAEEYGIRHPKLLSMDDIFKYCDWWDRHK